MRRFPEVLALVCLIIWSSSTNFYTMAQEVYEPYQLNETLLYLQSVNFVLQGDTITKRSMVKISERANVTSTLLNPTNLILELKFPDSQNGTLSVTEFSLTMSMLNRGGYWRLVEANMSVIANFSGADHIFVNYTNKKIISRMELTAPLKMSFHCGRYGPFSPIVDIQDRANSTASIQFIDFQLQTFMKDSSKFGDSYDCVGFFTIGILSGWFITIILLIILSWGIKMVMDVNTMDRFDDPKGKSITVNATD